MDTILFSSSFFNKRKIHEDLEEEYNAIVKTGKYNVILYDIEKWDWDHKLYLSKKPKRKIMALYREWMMRPEEYTLFYQQLLEQNIQLITTPEMYENLHLFPNVYPYIQEDTPRILTYPMDDLNKPIKINKILEVFPRFMVKDYVKSLKDSRFPKYFDASFDQNQFDQYMKEFYQYQGDLLTKGICIKEYVDLKKIEGTTNEVRVFYFNKQVLSISQNSNQPKEADMPPKKLIEKYRFLDSIFYIVDYAQLEDGSWIIIEAGDGSVSGLGLDQDPYMFYSSLYDVAKYI